MPDLPIPDLPVPDLPVPDLPIPDLPIPDMPVKLDGKPMPKDLTLTSCAKVVGLPCTKSGTQCGPAATCLLISSNGLMGVCTCSCFPDNTATPLINEDTCPGAITTGLSRCGKVSLTGGTSK